VSALQVEETPFVPLFPAVMAQGGSAVASAAGYEAFFSNPAGFSRGDGEFALSSAAWAYARADQLMDEAVRIAFGSSSAVDTFNVINTQVTEGGFGFGSSIGIGWVKDGIGFGAALILDSLLHGSTMLGSTGDLTATLGFIGGQSYPFELLGIQFHAGWDLRPMIRIHVPMTNTEAISLVYAVAQGTDLGAALSSTNALHGAGLGIDLGVIAEAGWFSFGLSVRDLGGTRFVYYSSSLGAVTGSLAAQGSLPAGASTSDSYIVPMDVGVGMAFHPDLGSFSSWIDPSVRLDLRDINGLFDGSAVFWTLIHAGAEVRFLNLLTLRGGVCQGYLTAGAGLSIPFMELSFAVFTRELGLHVGDWPNACLSVDAVIRI
jgi:hypothetical protein